MRTFKQVLAVLLISAAAVYAETVRMGQLGVETLVETDGESVSGVRLVSKAYLDKIINAIALGDDSSWMTLNGPTATIHHVVRKIGVEGDRKQLIVTGVSEDHFAPYFLDEGVVFSYFDNVPAGAEADESWIQQPVPYYTAYWSESRELFRVYFTQAPRLAAWNATNQTELSLPVTLEAPDVYEGRPNAAKGSMTLDWYGLVTNEYRVVVAQDFESFATTNWVDAVKWQAEDIATNVLWSVVVSNGHWIVKESAR